MAKSGHTLPILPPWKRVPIKQPPLPTWPPVTPSPGAVNAAAKYARIGGAAAVGKALPIIYGKQRVEGRVFYYQPVLPTGSPVYVGVTIGVGEIEEVTTVRVNGFPLPIGGIDGLTYVTYLGTTAGDADSGVYSEINSVLYSTWKFPGIAYAVFAIDPRVVPFESIDSFAFDVKGLKVKDFRTGVTAYSANAALCLWDFLTHSRHGCKRPEALMDDADDTTTWWKAADRCDETVDSEPRYELNIAITEQATAESLLEMLRAHCAADVFFQKGLWRCVIEGEREPVLAFDDSSNCRDVTISTLPSADKPTSVTVTFPNPDKEYEEDVARFPEAAVTGLQIAETSYSLQGLRSGKQAKRLAAIYQRKGQFEEYLADFIGGPEAVRLVRRDIVTLTTQDGLAAQEFDVLDIEQLDTGEYRISAREHDPSAYSDDAQATDTLPTVDTGNPYDTPPDVNFVSWAEGYRYSSWSTRIWWPAPFALKSATLYSSGWTAFGNAYVNAYVNDGDLVTAGAGFTNPQNPTTSGFKLDLGSGVTKTFVGLRATPVSGTDGDPWLLKIAYSDDNITYTDVSSEVHGTDWIGWESVGAHRYWKLTLVYPNGASSPCDFAELQFYETDQLFPWVAGYEVRRASTGDLLLWVPASARPTAASPLDVTPFLTTGQQSGYATVTYDLLIHVVSGVGFRSTGRETGKTTFATADGTQFNVATHVQSGSTPSAAQTGSDYLDGTRKGGIIHGTTEARTDGRLSVKHLQKNMTGLGTSFNDFDPGAPCVILGLHTLDGDITITGIDSTDFDDAVLCVVNEDGGTSTITLKHMSTSSLAGNRMDLAEDSDLVLAVGDAAWLNWDSTIGRWVGLTNQKGTGTGSLTVKESDGSPSVANVTEIRVSGATVTDEGGGAVTITVTAGAGGVSLLTDEFTGAGTATQVCDLSANLATSDAESVVGVYYDGVLQPTTGWSVTDANTITLDPGPVSGVAIAITFYATLPTGVTGVHVEADAGDGSTTDFPLANTAIANGLVGGYVDGVRQSGTTLIDGGTKARYATAPTDGTVVETVVLY